MTVIDANDMEYIACPKMDVDLGMSNQLRGGRESQNVGVYEPLTLYSWEIITSLL